MRHMLVLCSCGSMYYILISTDHTERGIQTRKITRYTKLGEKRQGHREDVEEAETCCHQCVAHGWNNE